jgi:hypothetical protein
MVLKMGDVFIALGLHWDLPIQMCIAPVSSPLNMLGSARWNGLISRFALGSIITPQAATYYQQLARCAPALSLLAHSSQTHPRIAHIAV